MLSLRSYSAALPGLLAAVLLSFISGQASAKILIEPNPNANIGIMTTESKYFNCRGTNGEHVAWIDPNNREINNDPANRIYVVAKKNTVKLELKNPVKGDSGQYKCINKKTSQHTWSNSPTGFNLHVFNPTVVTGTTHYTKSEGSRFQMECIATSDRQATVDFSWTFNDIDLSTDRNYAIRNEVAGARNDEMRTVSKLEILNVSKEHDGKYACQVDTTNAFLSDEKELKVVLRVQYKPKFDEKTPKYIWISEEAIQQGGPLTVNISCIVAADPVAKISWFYGVGHEPITPGSRLPSSLAGTRVNIADNENYSTLTLTFNSIDHLRGNQRGRPLNKYTCRANNEQGEAKNTFEIKIGRIPDSPQIVSVEYKDGSIHLQLNESHIEPQVDIYRLEVGSNQAHLFNKSKTSNFAKDNSTFVIPIPLPRGEHRVIIFAHNPVGWSEHPSPGHFVHVVSSSMTVATSWIATIIIFGVGQMMMEGNLSRLFIGSLLNF
ncbi:hypothetical protein TYRP_016426 [Tyrophagus putrescentiae]|nr:hypothetical protein TYRP_016426 [Tyrophagus putrescentiae]